MRLVRAMTAVLAVVAVGAVGLPGQASAAPSAPYTVVTINSRGGSHVWDDSNSVFVVEQHNTTREVFELNGGNPATNLNGVFHLMAPWGETLNVGTYPMSNPGYTATLSIGGTMCNDGGWPNTVTIKSLTRDAAGLITSISASLASCMSGEVRWKANDGYVDAVQTQSDVWFLMTGVGQRSVDKTVTFTSVGSQPLQLGALSIEGEHAASFGITANGCSAKTLTYGQSCSVSFHTRPTKLYEQSAKLRIADNSSLGFRHVDLHVFGRQTPIGNFFPLGPTRILDTRSGAGAPKAAIGPKKVLSLQVAGVAGVPGEGIAAVVLNVTATNPTAASYLTAYPSGTARPNASNLNFTPGWTGANAVTVPVGANGKVDIYNEAGSVHVVADVLGYYRGTDDISTGVGGQFQPHDTVRLLDTRDPGEGALPGGWSISVTADYGAAANPHVKAFAVNITAVVPQGHGYLTAWSGSSGPPLASTLNFTPGSVVPNFAVVPTSNCTYAPECYGIPQIKVYNGGTKATHVLVDIVGFFDDTEIGPGMRFHPLTPTRIADTRTQLGGAGTLGPASTATLTAPAPAAVDETWALVANVTGVNWGGAGTYLTAWAAGEPLPTASNLNLMPFEVRPNAAFVVLGPGNKYLVYNAASTVDVIVDVAGRFDYYVPPGSVAAAGAGAGRSVAKAPTAGASQRQAPA